MTRFTRRTYENALIRHRNLVQEELREKNLEGVKLTAYIQKHVGSDLLITARLKRERKAKPYPTRVVNLLRKLNVLHG